MRQKSRWALSFLVAISCIGCGDGGSAKNCNKGKPCGKTCIAANETCHVSSVLPTGGSPLGN
jgi:hypothetical protein